MNCFYLNTFCYPLTILYFQTITNFYFYTIIIMIIVIIYVVTIVFINVIAIIISSFLMFQFYICINQFFKILSMWHGQTLFKVGNEDKKTISMMQF